jgi:cell wall-associated NlpC family hydrolase
MTNWITHLCRLARAPLVALGLALVVAVAPFAASARAQQGPVPSSMSAGPDVVIAALAHLGVPYRFGGSSPVTGFDCSGLVRHVFLDTASVDLPRSAHDMVRQGVPVVAGELQPGDLVFFNTRGRPHSHVGIYMGDGRFVHAPARRGHVKIESMEASYWRRRFNGARRVLPTAPMDFSGPQLVEAAFAPGSVPSECAGCDR